jgi:hypothetical protein
MSVLENAENDQPSSGTAHADDLGLITEQVVRIAGVLRQRITIEA